MIRQLMINAARDRLRQKLQRPDENDRPLAALVFGAGASPGIGAAVAQRIAAGGLPVYVTGRNVEKINASVAAITAAGGQAKALSVDTSEPAQIDAAFAQVAADGYAVDLVVFNVGTNRPRKFLDTSESVLEESWRADCLSGFLVGQQAVKAILPRGRGTVLFTGASASLRGKAGFGAFAANKAGLRIMTQAMAREFGPQGIHVAHFIIDGLVDGDRLRGALPALLDKQGEDGTLNPDDIAETYWQVYQQHRSVWTHEIDLRPCKETW